jgi:excisionase family DNA binding protein
MQKSANITQKQATLDPLTALIQSVISAENDRLLDEITEIVRARPVQKLLGNGELAQWLSVAPETVRKMRADGMPFLRVGETYRYDLDAVKKWLENKGNK